jgi:hypothetical protein
MIRALGIVALLFVAACGPAALSDDDFWRPWYDDPLDGGDSADGPVTMGGSCNFSVSETTAALAGRYAPRNVGAIWIDDHAGHFVKSLTVWGSRRLNHLDRWESETAQAGVPGNRVDAITSATASSFGDRAGQWNCTDYMERPVAAGSYQVCFEITSSNSAGPSDCVMFKVGSGPFQTRPGDTAEFQNRVLEMTK